MTPRQRRRLRWLVPATVVAGVAAATAVPRMLPAGADPVPVLPPLTAAQLMDKVRTTNVTTLSGDIEFTARLGLPDLSAFGGGASSSTIFGLLSGTHTAHVWIDGPEKLRLAVDSPQAESGWIRNGTDLWSWQSDGQRVVHTTLPEVDEDSIRHADVPAVDPTTAAQQLLDKVDPTTAVTVRTPGYVAGRPVYELVVSPRSANSTIADGEIAVDAATGVPLAVRVHAKDSDTPVIDVEFTSISYDQPAAKTFEFTPPPGSRVREADSPADLIPFGGIVDRGGRGERAARRAAAAADPARSAPATDAASDPSSRPGAKVVGEAWDSVVIARNVTVGPTLSRFLADEPTIAVGAQSGRLVSTRLVNVLVLDDGRVAIGAVTPDALVAAVAAA